jgi:hypothetical protein
MRVLGLRPSKRLHGRLNAAIRVSLVDNSKELLGLPDARSDEIVAVTAQEDRPLAIRGRRAPFHLPSSPHSFPAFHYRSQEKKKKTWIFLESRPGG